MLLDLFTFQNFAFLKSDCLLNIAFWPLRTLSLWNRKRRFLGRNVRHVFNVTFNQLIRMNRTNLIPNLYLIRHVSLFPSENGILNFSKKIQGLKLKITWDGIIPYVIHNCLRFTLLPISFSSILNTYYHLCAIIS